MKKKLATLSSLIGVQIWSYCREKNLYWDFHLNQKIYKEIWTSWI